MKCLSINLNGELAGSGISKTPLRVSFAFLSKCFTDKYQHRPGICYLADVGGTECTPTSRVLGCER